MALIMVIEEDELIRSILCEVIEQSGYDVIEAPDCESGERLFHTKHADLVIGHLCDSGSGVPDGITLLKEKFPDARIITMAGRKTESTETAGLMSTIRTLTRPFKPQEMMRLIREMVLNQQVSAE